MVPTMDMPARIATCYADGFLAFADLESMKI